MEEELKVCVVSSPRSMASVVPFSNFIDILARLSASVSVITGNEGARALVNRPSVSGYSLTYTPGKNPVSRMLGHIIFELKICLKILEINPSINIYAFFMSEGMVLPMLLARITHKPVILVLAGSTTRILSKNRDLYSRPLELMEEINYRLANRIVVYSPNIIDEWGLSKYREKVSVAHEHFLDFKAVNSKKGLDDRANVIGYLGRLGEEKGVFNFVQAIPGILQLRNDVQFLIGGDGQLRGKIGTFLKSQALSEKVEVCGWISHENITDYLNCLKLLILPSYTEGLPNILLEAMACGTPVLATKVGAIPDIVTDEETGFLMENNSPESIVKNVIRALNHPGLERIAQQGKSFVQKEFTLANAQEGYRKIFHCYRQC